MKAIKLKDKKLRGWSIAIIAIILLAVYVRQCSHSHDSPFYTEYEKAGGDTLDIAIEMNPTIYSVRGDSVFGRDYEILRQISKKRSIPMKFHPFVPLKQAMEYLDQGLYDIVVASIPSTADLKEKYLMSEPVYLNREILVQRLDSAGRPQITSQIQLGGDTVWITSDSPFADRIKNLSAEIGDTIYMQSSPEYSAEHLFLLVAAGVIKHAVINETIAKEMHADYPQVDISTPVSFTQFQSWAVNRDNQQLLDSINAWIKDL